MKTKFYLFTLIVLGAFINPEKSFSQWVSEAVADDSSKYILGNIENPMQFDEANTYHVSFIKEIPLDQPGRSRYEIWYKNKELNGNWLNPSLISDEEKHASRPSIAVSPGGVVYFSFFSEIAKGLKIIKKDGQEETLLELPNIENIANVKLYCDDSENLHLLVSTSYVEEIDKRNVITELIYAVYTEGEWTTINYIPDSGHSTENVQFNISPDGAAHALYHGPEEDNYLYHLTNRSGEWVKTPIIETSGLMEVRGFISSDTDIHIGIYKHDLFINKKEILYIRVSQDLQPEIFTLEYDEESEINAFSFDVNSDGDPVFVFSVLDESPAPIYNGLYISTFNDGVFEHTQILGQAWDKLDAFLAFDNENKLLVLANLGNQRDLFLLYEQEHFSASFNIIDHNQDPITDAVITLNEQTNSAGEYTFTELLPGTYTYSVSREGYYPAEGEITIANEDLEVDVEMETDYTGSTMPLQQNLSIFPNPAIEQVNIKSGSLIETISLYDITGRVVFNATPGSFSYAVKVNGIPAGVYFLKINSEGTHIRKLMINNR